MNTTVTDTTKYQSYTDNFPKDIYENFTLQLAFAIKWDDSEYFLKLLSPSYFVDLTMKEKFNAAVVAIGVTNGDKEKYLHHLILDTTIDRITFDSSIHGILADKGFGSDYVTDLFGLREFKKLDKELPINGLKEEKRTKV